MTDDAARIEGCEEIQARTVADRFAMARDAFIESNATVAVNLGTVGEVTTEYAVTEFGGEERVVLQVRTPDQTVSFGASGGRVYAWDVRGMEPFVAGANFGTDGLAMDMLWLPASSRWSGDEVDELALAGCSNDGREARVVYEGPLDKGAPGIRLRKTYRIASSGTALAVEVALRNERVDQEPAQLAYWSHNVFNAEAAHFISEEMTHETEPGATTVLTAAGLPDELRPDVLMPDKIIGATGPVYAEYFPERSAGLLFRLPASFMNVYRWCSHGKNMCGSEWMTQPLSIPAGGTESLSFSVTAMPEATPGSLQQALASLARETPEDDNLLPYGFADLDEEGLPADWTVDVRGENAETASITASLDEDGSAVVTMAMPQEASVYLDTTRPTQLDPTGDYMLAVQVKVEDMHYTGNWYKRPAGVRIYVYGTENKHTWLAIYGEGSTDGWVTALLPFPLADHRERFANSRVFLRCYNMTGTVSFRSPMILRQPQGVAVQQSFRLPDGTLVPDGKLQLRR